MYMCTHIWKIDSLNDVIKMNRKSHTSLSVSRRPGRLGKWLNESYVDNCESVSINRVLGIILCILETKGQRTRDFYV